MPRSLHPPKVILSLRCILSRVFWRISVTNSFEKLAEEDLTRIFDPSIGPGDPRCWIGIGPLTIHQKIIESMVGNRVVQFGRRIGDPDQTSCWTIKRLSELTRSKEEDPSEFFRFIYRGRHWKIDTFFPTPSSGKSKSSLDMGPNGK